MAAKKPAKGTATPRQRAPRTSTKNQPLAVPLMENEDNAANLREAMARSEAALPPGWQDLEAPKQEVATRSFEKAAPKVEYDFTPSDLARKYAMVTRVAGGSPNTIRRPEIESAKDRAQSYMRVASTQPLTTSGQRPNPVSTPQSEWANARARYSETKELAERNKAREASLSTKETAVGKEYPLTPRVQEEIRSNVLPVIKTVNTLPGRHETSVSPNGTVSVTPIHRGPAGEVAGEPKVFSPQETSITADDYRMASGGHVVDGQHATAYTKHTTNYRRTNNNGVMGITPVGETQHEGTFYRHPETGEMIQTMKTPVDKQYNAIQMHHSALYSKYATADAAKITGKSNAAVRYQLAGGSTSYNWAKETLPKAIKSSRGGDVAGTMKELEQNPDAIHDLFHDHFVVGPQKEKVYMKAAKAGVVPLLPKQSKLEETKAKLAQQANAPQVF
jgi:hypothetical protein